MKVSQLMQDDVATVTPQDTLSRASELMWDLDIGTLPVIDQDQKVVGMITDRDICMHAYMMGERLDDLPVVGAMSTDVRSCDPNDSIEDAETIMSRNQVRRLPVIDKGRLVGLLSINDLAQEAYRERKNGKNEPGLEEIGSTLAHVCKPRRRARA